MVKWKKPNLGSLKLNSDGCPKGKLGILGGRGVVRDSKEGFVFTYACHIGIATSLQAEVKALLVGIRLCVERGMEALHVEVDSLILVQVIRSSVHAHGPYTQTWRRFEDTLVELYKCPIVLEMLIEWLTFYPMWAVTFLGRKSIQIQAIFQELLEEIFALINWNVLHFANVCSLEIWSQAFPISLSN